jgi:tRNA (cytidine/uridine-2'-O-)-methyltransferase
VNVRLWNSFYDLQGGQSPNTRYFFLTTKTKRTYYDVTFRPDDFLVFGRETRGLPETLLAANIDSCITIPMCGTRSLNLATAVAIVLFEAVRQQQS